MDPIVLGQLEVPLTTWLPSLVALAAMAVAWRASRRPHPPVLTEPERIAELEQIITDQRQRTLELVRERQAVQDLGPVIEEHEKHALASLGTAVRDICGAEDFDSIAEAVGRHAVRMMAPAQWTLHVACRDDSDDLTLAASGTAIGGSVGTIGRRLDPSRGRLGLVMRRRKLMDDADFAAEPPLVRERVERTESAGFPVTAAIPVELNGRIIALLAVGRTDAELDHPRAALEFLAECTRLGLERLALRRARERTKSRDDLTGLYRKGHFSARASEFCYQNRAVGVPNGLVVLGVDDYRGYLSNHDHVDGDRLLKAISERVLDMFGLDALTGRWGQDEFIVYLPGWEEDRLAAHADALRQAIADSGWSDGNGRYPRTVTVSAGVAAASDDEGAFDRLVAEAADRLVFARWSGGNQVCSSETAIEDTEEPPITEELAYPLRR